MSISYVNDRGEFKVALDCTSTVQQKLRFYRLARGTVIELTFAAGWLLMIA